MSTTPPTLPLWLSRLRAWPGVLTLLSVLAVVLGAQPPVPDTGPRWTAGPQAPALPEARPAAPSGPLTPLLASPPARPLTWLRERFPRPPSVWPPLPERRAPELTAWGRQQSDGG